MTASHARGLRRATILLALTTIPLAISACGGAGGSSATTDKGAVEDQIGFTQAGIAERQSRVEAAIAECMKAQGFEYTPVDPLAQQAAVTGSTRLSDEDFVKQFGYGVSTLLGRGGAQSDPNARIRQALGEADRNAYDRALFGENPGATFAVANDTGDFTRLGGCTKQATESVFGGADILTQLQGKLGELDDTIAQDQRVVKAVEQWAACMGKAGIQYENPEDIEPDLIKRFQAIVGSKVERGATTPIPTGADQTALSDLQRTEVAAAVADLACEQEFIVPVEDVVRPQYEATFRQENRDLITRLRPTGA